MARLTTWIGRIIQRLLYRRVMSRDLDLKNRLLGLKELLALVDDYTPHLFDLETVVVLIRVDNLVGVVNRHAAIFNGLKYKFPIHMIEGVSTMKRSVPLDLLLHCKKQDGAVIHYTFKEYKELLSDMIGDLLTLDTDLLEGKLSVHVSEIILLSDTALKLKLYKA